MSWLEVSLTVDGELAEAVADVLARFAPNGVAAEQAVKYDGNDDEGAPVGPIVVRAYLPINENTADTQQKLESALHFLGMIRPLPSPVFTVIPDQNWMETWKEQFKPIPVGKSLIILPAWLDPPTGGNRTAVRIDPGMAFGTGTHPTTQLCLELVEGYLAALPAAGRGQSTVIDVGCGSGILSIAALKLGVQSALGVDIDNGSLQASCQNASFNAVSDRLSLGLGSIKEIRAGMFSLRRATIVLANILATVIISLFGEGLAELLEPGGIMILSGILVDQAGAVIESAEQHGLELSLRTESGDWVAMLFGHARE